VSDRVPGGPLSRRRFCAALAAAAATPCAAATPLETLRARGTLVVGVYQDMPPFHVGGRGVDVDIAQALAAALDLKLSLLPFAAGENMDDDLRNVVWRGHYLGWGPADLMLHVPVDAPLMQANPQVQIFAPYYRERVMIARRLDDVPQMESLAAFKGKRIAVPGQSIAGWLLIGAEGGAYREQLVTKLADGTQAARMLQSGEVSAAAGLLSELESVLSADARFAIEPLPMPRAPRDGWALGCAVRKTSGDLAERVQAAINDLARDGRMAKIFAAGGLSWRRP
jgi:ABC-type amino acid transport substrate-binding protein